MDMNEIANWRKSKKARLYIIGGLLVVVVILGVVFESLRMWMIGVGIVLLAAFAFEVPNTDVDLGTMIEERSVSDAVIERDEEGNLETSEEGGFLTSILRDREGNEVPEGTPGEKRTDETISVQRYSSPRRMGIP